jgi:hypothetical protein
VDNRARNLILTDQELRFAGHALRTVFSGNTMSYVSEINFSEFKWNYLGIMLNNNSNVVEQQETVGSLEHSHLLKIVIVVGT